MSLVPEHWHRLEAEVVAEGFRFPEGPSVLPDGSICLVNCDDSVVNRVLSDGSVEEYARVPGKGNGSKLRPDGTLLVCDYKANRIVAIDSRRQVSLVTERDVDGQPFRGPNDLCLAKSGDFYFTAPQGSSRERPIGKVYFHSSATGETTVVAEGLAFPNGLSLSADESELYVAESQHARILRFSVLRPGALMASRVFAGLPDDHEPDGIEFDEEGNLYVAYFGSGQVLVLDRGGELMFRFEMGGRKPTNLAFGGPQGDWLYVTEAETNRLLVLKVGKRGLRLPASD